MSRREEPISSKIAVKNGVLSVILMNHTRPKNRYATIMTRNLRHNITILYVNAIIHEWYVWMEWIVSRRIILCRMSCYGHVTKSASTLEFWIHNTISIFQITIYFLLLFTKFALHSVRRERGSFHSKALFTPLLTRALQKLSNPQFHIDFCTT